MAGDPAATLDHEGTLKMETPCTQGREIHHPASNCNPLDCQPLGFIYVSKYTFTSLRECLCVQVNLMQLFLQHNFCFCWGKG